MRRRDFLAVLLSILAARRAQAQPSNRVYRIGYLGINPPTTPILAEVWKAFDEGLREHGLIERQNVIIERRFSEGREGRQPGFAAELVAWKADVIVVGSIAATRAAKEATQTIPIVMASVSDPVRYGLVVSLARPGGNITGVSSQLDDVLGKQNPTPEGDGAGAHAPCSDLGRARQSPSEARFGRQPEPGGSLRHESNPCPDLRPPGHPVRIAEDRGRGSRSARNP